MKSYLSRFVLLFLICSMSNVYAQTGSTIVVGFVDVTMNRQGKFNYNPETTIGHPFLEQKFQPGEAFSTNGEQTKDVNIRYNLVTDTFELDKGTIVLKDPNVGIKYNGKVYSYSNCAHPSVSGVQLGYHEVLKSFPDGTQLVKKTAKIFKEGKPAKTSYHTAEKARFDTETTLFLVRSKCEVIELENHKKKILKSFPKSAKKELSKFIKTNNIDFGEDYTGLIQFLNYANSKLD